MRCLLLQVLSAPLLVGWLLSNPLIIFNTSVLLAYIAMVVLLPLPQPQPQQQTGRQQHNTEGTDTPAAAVTAPPPGSWWQRLPMARDWVVMAYRLSIPASLWLFTGRLRGQELLLLMGSAGQWRTLRYVWRGWHGMVQPLPLRMQLITCLGEWFLTSRALAALEPYLGTTTPMPDTSTSSCSLLAHLVNSCVWVVVLPMVVAAYWERCLAARYKAQQRSLTAAAAAAAAAADAAAGGCGSSKAPASTVGQHSSSPNSSSSRLADTLPEAWREVAWVFSQENQAKEQQKQQQQQQDTTKHPVVSKVQLAAKASRAAAAAAPRGDMTVKQGTPQQQLLRVPPSVVVPPAVDGAAADPAAGGDAGNVVPAGLMALVQQVLPPSMVQELVAAAAQSEQTGCDYARVTYAPCTEVVHYSIKVGRLGWVGEVWEQRPTVRTQVLCVALVHVPQAYSRRVANSHIACTVDWHAAHSPPCVASPTTAFSRPRVPHWLSLLPS
jgi:hypothetical protein